MRKWFTRIRRLLTAPVFEEDEDKTRAAALFYPMQLALLTILVIYAIFALATWTNPQYSLPLVSILLVVGVGTLALARLGYVGAASAIFLIVLWAFMTAVTVIFSGVQGSSVYGFVVVTVIGGLLLGGRGGFIFAGLSVLTELALVAAHSQGLLPKPIGLDTLLSTWASLCIYVLVSAVVLNVATGNLRRALERARHNEKALTESSRELQGIRAALEQRNAALRRAVERYGAFMTEVAQGNLAGRLHLEDAEEGADEPLGILARSLNETVASLQRMTARIRDAATNLTSASAEILAATTQQASGASEQSAAIAQASSTIDEVRAIAEQTAQRAQRVTEQAERTTASAQAGQQAVADTVGRMQEVRHKVETIAHNILDLSEHTQAIGQIIAAVGDIASQSNMLALNAAVEAARAGEAGRGFAVVATEVRALAEQSRAATVQVRDLLTEIQRGVNAAVMATEEGIKGADAGMRQASQAGEVIRQLAESVVESVQVSTGIAAAATQQTTGMEQMAVAMHNIQQAMAQSLASTQQSERAAGDLHRLADQLYKVVEQYRL